MEQYKQLYKYNSSFESVKQFHQQIIPNIINQIREYKSDKYFVVGWYQVNHGCSTSFSRDIISLFTKYSKNDKNLNYGLFMVIDIEKSIKIPKYPCIEIYNLHSASKSIDNNNNNYTIAFTVPEE